MRKIFTKISHWSKKSTFRSKLSLVSILRAARVDISKSTKEHIKRQLFVRIGLVSAKQAQSLERRIKRPTNQPNELIDFLAYIAMALRQLPKVLPRVVFKEHVRDRLTALRFRFWIPRLRRVSAFAVVVLLLMSVVLVSFVSQTQTTLAEVARLDVQSGSVKIRPANEKFFTIANDGMSMYVGDTLRVESDSGAELAFLDHSTLRLAADTEIEITAFRADTDILANSQVNLALVTGVVNVDVAKGSTTATFAIETPSGTVSAQKAKFSVEVGKNGATQVITDEETVALRTDDTTTTELTAGKTALLADSGGIEIATTQVVGTPSSKLDLPDPSAVATELDILQIRLFGALSDAQAGNTEVAQKTKTAVGSDLTRLLADFGVTDVVSDQTAVLSMTLIDQTADTTERSEALYYLTVIDQLESILDHYFVTPTLRQGVPELELVRSQNYQPTAQLHRIYTALYAQSLAAESAGVAVQQLITTVAAEYTAQFATVDDPVAYTTVLLRGMANQPLYLDFLQALQAAAPAEVQVLLTKKIAELDAARASYIGR